MSTDNIDGEDGLEYIARSPAPEHGGFHPLTAEIAKGAIAELAHLRSLLTQMLDVAAGAAVWRPIDTAPANDTAVDIWSQEHGRLTNYRLVCTSRTNSYYDSVESGFSVVRDATHWMPIPFSPGEDEPRREKKD